MRFILEGDPTKATQIEIEGLDALNLLRPQDYPVSPALYAAAATQADAVIVAESQGIVDKYVEDDAEPIINEFIRASGSTLLTAIATGFYEKYAHRAAYGEFVKFGTIDSESRHGLYCYRPSYVPFDADFIFSEKFAPDLLAFYNGLRFDYLRNYVEYGDESAHMFDGFDADVPLTRHFWPEDDPEHERLVKISAALSEFTGGVSTNVEMPTSSAQHSAIWNAASNCAWALRANLKLLI